jgi:hypothetical protein
LKVSLHPEALIELQDQATWYEQRRRGLGFELLAEITASLQRLAEQPELGALVPHAPPARKLLLASFPLSVVYS